MSGHIRRRTSKTKGTRYQARYADPSAPRHSTRKIERTFKTKREAQTWLTAQASSVLSGTHISPAQSQTPSGFTSSFHYTGELEPDDARAMGNRGVAVGVGVGVVK